MGARSSTLGRVGGPTPGVGAVKRLAAISGLILATLATWQLVIPVIHARATHTTAARTPVRQSLPVIPIRGVHGVEVAVLNVTGTTGAAAAAAASLQARGVHVGYVGNGVFTNHQTAVLYRHGAKRPARALANALGLSAPKQARAALASSIGNARIVLLVGPGGVRG